MAHLVRLDSARLGEVLALSGAAFIEGQASVSAASGGWKVARTNPQARVAVNGHAPDGAPLRAGDLLAVGDSTFVYLEGAGERGLLEALAAAVARASEQAGLLERVTTDSSTRVLNRQMITLRLEEEVRKGGALSVVRVEPDHLGDKRDIYGPAVADRVFAELAALVKEHLGGAGFVARHGPEEFLGVLPGVPGDRALDLAKDIRLAAEGRDFNSSDEPIRCTVSVGVTALQPGETVEPLLKRAETALDAARRAGGNRAEWR